MLLQIEELTKVYRSSGRVREAGTRANDGISLAIGEGAGLLDDYPNLVALVGDLQDRSRHAGLDRLDDS